MKRNIALLLIAALLASFLVLPVSAAEIPEIKLSVVPFTEDAENGTIIEGTAKETYKAGDAVACKVEFVNNDVVRWLNTFAIDLMYDNTKLSPYSFLSADEEDVGPLVNELGGLGTPSMKPDEGHYPFAIALTPSQRVGANAAKTVAYILFKIDGKAESGDLTFAVDKDSEKNQIMGSLSKNGEAEKFTEIDYSDIAVEAPVIGVAPTIDSVKVDPKSAEYASGDVLTLSATSKAGSNITSLVTFEVTNDAGSPATGFTLDAENATLTVNETNPAPVGTYTVKASAKEGESQGEATGTFTIAPKTVTNPTLTVVGFGKGQAKGSLTFKDVTGGLAVPTGYNCYEGQEAIGIPNNERTFEAGTTYTIAITLNPAENYAFDEKNLGSVTITINGEEKIVEIVKKTDFETPYYQAVVTATTADKDVPELTLTPIDATYGDLLSTLTLTGTATFNGQPVEGTFAWADEYNAETPVGDAGEQTFNVVFTPAQQEVYATVTGTVKVNVAKKQITFTKSDYKWRASNNETPTEVKDDGEIVFTYDGKEHGIEAYCENSAIADDVEIVYDSGERSFTSSKGSTVTAHVEVKDKKNYELDGGPNIQSGSIRILPIVIDYTDEYTHSVEVCYTTSSVDIPLSAFGLPDEVLNDTNNKYWMRTDAVVAGAVDVISGTPTSFDEANRTLTLNLKNSLTKDDAGKTATVTLGLKVNNYETTNPGVGGIANKEEKLFILKLTVNIIEKGDAGLTITGIPETLTLVYGESAEWSYNVTNPGENGHISDSVTPAGILNNDPHKLTAIGVGEATVTITYSSDTTYAQREFTIIVTPKPLTATVSHDPITYGDEAPADGYTVTFSGLLTGDEITDTDYTVGTEYTAGKPAGTYKITCALGDSIKNYTLEAKDVTGELVVNKKELTDDAVTVTVLGETPVYDGSKKIPAVEVKYGETTLAAADYTVSYSNNVNAGVDTATVTVTSTDDSSYKFTATKNFTIAQAPISGAVIDDIADVTYDTKAHTPEVTVTFNGSKLTDADYTVSYSEDCINAGTVTVTVTGKGNFTGTASKTFTINKANLTLSPYTISKLCTETEATTETLPSDFFLAGETETGFSIALSVRNVLDIFAKEPEVVSGENKITYQLNGKVGEASYFVTVTPVSHNYNVGEYDLKIETYDRTDVSGSIEFKDGSAVYTGSGITYERATLNGNSFNMTYSYTPTSNGAKLDKSGLPLTVGTYTVAVTFNSDASFGYKTATFTITKATPTGTPGYTKLETSGKTLADAKLTVGTIRPAGTIAWDLPLTTVLEDGKAYAWTFTPNDTHNYTILTGTLVPYVDDGMDYIPGVIGGNTGSFNFHDVSRLDYFYDAVKWAAENGIASGTGRYTFSPNAVCTRAQTVTFLWRAAGSPLPRYRVCPFTDVQPSDYYYNAVLWAVEQGITTGLNATTFGPDVTVTRGQVATFLYRAASAAKPNTFNPFTDVKTTAYNYNAILWAYDNRITTGTSDTTFSPDAYCTRAQIVTFLYRYYQGR